MAEGREPDQTIARWTDGGGQRSSVADGDWRRFRELRKRARERFSDESLLQVLAIARDDSMPVTEREFALDKLMRHRQRERRALFEDFNRAHLPLMLHVMIKQGLLKTDELTGLSLGLRRALGLLT